MDMNAQARAVLEKNDRGGHTVPTDGLYPYQWNWDSAFTALGIATYDVERAYKELETLFEAQWPCGMVPHIVFRADAPSYFPGPSIWGAKKSAWPSSGITNPPIATSAIAMLAERDPERAEPFLEKLDAWHGWLHAHRDPEGLGVIATAHPWEDGRDNLPDWDAPGRAIDVSGVGAYQRADTALVDPSMRPTKAEYDRYLALVYFGRDRDWDQARIARETPFCVADPMMTATTLRAERDLAALMKRFGRDASAVEQRIDRLEKGFDRLWSEAAQAYSSFDLRTGQRADSASSASFLAFWAGVETRKAPLLETLARFAQGRKLVASFDPDHAGYDHRRYWRGPTWAVVNFMVGQGLAGVGEQDWAERVRADTASMIRKGSFAEYFSPETGEALGGSAFSWTAAIWLAWGLAEVA